MKPITPDEVAKAKLGCIPDGVIEAFNEVIAEHWSNGCSHFKQEEVVTRIIRKTLAKRQSIFDNHWLDVEDIYREAGWEVEYDKPGFNEDYPATFEFRKRKNV